MKQVGRLILSLAAVQALGFISGLAAMGAAEVYESLRLPAFAPHAGVFGVVWPILYGVLGVVLYRLRFYLPEKNDSEKVADALNYFTVQLVINLLWTPIFFLLNNFWAAFFWLLLLIGTAGASFFKMCDADKVSFYLFIPYLLWIIFAAVLNFFVAVMN
ncbi:MAG: tryptophan-rich sensory protein [Clostridia bacterium]|nr:tryptophan-rich sensory protein [Clostridia bacterium]